MTSGLSRVYVVSETGSQKWGADEASIPGERKGGTDRTPRANTQLGPFAANKPPEA
jgi:hypothetical protein